MFSFAIKTPKNQLPQAKKASKPKVKQSKTIGLRELVFIV